VWGRAPPNALCFCQAKKYPFDDRKSTHLSSLDQTLTIEKVPT
jgi:hypothetical protein